MSLKDRTKLMFADELERMLEEMPLEKVVVRDLARRCGTSPQTFYYHFRDKYDLVAWMWLNSCFNTIGTRPFSTEAWLASLRLVEERRGFYRKVLADTSQNNLAGYMYDAALEGCTRLVKQYGPSPALTERQMLAIKGQTYNWIGLMTELINGTLGASDEVLAEHLAETTPDILREAYAHLDPSDDFNFFSPTTDGKEQ